LDGRPEAAGGEVVSAMTPETAKTITDAMARKHKTFRLIETRIHDKGANITFADLPDTDMRVISGWFDRAGALVMYVGREFRYDGYVMVAELRA
jgi:prepilin-type processing-associated H-X9-DG protein